MAQTKSAGIPLRIAEGLLVVLGLGTLQSCTSARAVAMAAGRLDQVRLGFGLDLQGTVSAGCAASTFSIHDPIHLSLQVTNASPGSVVSVSVRDVVTQRIAWSERRTVPAGQSHQTFEIGRDIARGRYRAESSLGGQSTSARPFVVHDKREGVR